MKQSGAVALMAVLTAATPAFTQTTDQSVQPSDTSFRSEARENMDSVSIRGTIAELDVANGTMTLQDGTRLVLPPLFQFTSFPAVGQEVDVDFVKDGDKMGVHSINVGGNKED